MANKGMTRCIECGGPVGQLNEDEDGAPCPVCAERLLETLPGIFHSPWGEGEPVEEGDETAAELAERERSEPPGPRRID